MPTGLYTRWHLEPQTGRFTPRQNKTRSFENMVMSYFQRTRPDCKIESSYTTGRQNKIDCFSFILFFHCNTVFEAMGCFYHFCPCQELRPSLTEEDIERGSRKRELDELRRGYIQEKGFTVIEMWECEWWRLYMTTTNFKLHIRENFPYRRSLTEHQLLEGIKKGNLFGYVQCDIEVPEILRANFANFPPIFKNTFVSKNIGDVMKTYAEEEGIRSQPQEMLISPYKMYTDHSSAFFLPATVALLYKNTPLRWVLSKQMFQQLCTVSIVRKKTRWRESKLQCSRRDNEVAS